MSHTCFHGQKIEMVHLEVFWISHTHTLGPRRHTDNILNDVFCACVSGVTKAVGHINDTLGPALIQSVSRTGQRVDEHVLSSRRWRHEVSPLLCAFQGISVLEQEKLDNLMIEMDGTDNKCRPLVGTVPTFDPTPNVSVRRFCLLQPSLAPTPFWVSRWPYAKRERRRRTSRCTVTSPIWRETKTWFSRSP